jgi:hypothetical protein
MKWCSASWEYCGYAECSWDLVREPTVKLVGKPDAGNPHVRFDERGWETGRRYASVLAPSLDSTTESAARRDKAAPTSLRLLAVLTVLFKHASARQAARAS